MARVVVGKAGNLVIVFKDKKSFSTKITVSPKDSARSIERKIKKAINAVADKAPDKYFDEIIALKAGAEARRVKRSLKPGKVKPGKKPKKPKVKPEKAPPRPTITIEWITNQLKATAKGDKKAQAAAKTLHVNREYVEEFLLPEKPGERSENQVAATVAVFNALYTMPKRKGKTPKFRLYLMARAAGTDKFAERLAELQSFIDKKGTLTKEADPEIISAADMFIRHYLLDIVAQEKVNPQYRKELMRLLGIKKRFKGEKDKPAPASIAGPMDSDTVTAALLYLRRYHLKKPKKARFWDAAKVRVLKKVEKPKGKLSPIEEFAKKNWKKLPTVLYDAAKGGKPADIVKLTRNLPEGRASLAEALQELERNDISLAFNKIFNEFLYNDDAFRAWADSLPERRGLVQRGVMLRQKDDPEKRERFVKAVQEFVNFTAKRTDRQWCKKLGGDLMTLYNDVLELNKDELEVNGVIDMRTITALAVLTWRMKNIGQPEGYWARSLGIKKEKPKREGRTIEL